jgi:hypothetical protein
MKTIGTFFARKTLTTDRPWIDHLAPQVDIERCAVDSLVVSDQSQGAADRRSRPDDLDTLGFEEILANAAANREIVLDD